MAKITPCIRPITDYNNACVHCTRKKLQPVFLGTRNALLKPSRLEKALITSREVKMRLCNDPFVWWVEFYITWLFWAVSTIVNDCSERLVSKITGQVQRRVFPDYHLQWYWQLKTKRRKYILKNSKHKTSQLAIGTETYSNPQIKLPNLIGRIHGAIVAETDGAIVAATIACSVYTSHL